MEQIKAMFEEMAKGGDFAEKMHPIIKAGNASDIIAAAGEKGFGFTEADWQGYMEWSNNLGTKKCDCDACKEVAPEELDVITGGVLAREDCWFHASGDTTDKESGRGRGRCNQFACSAFVPEKLTWYQCFCWGSSHCEHNWHKIDANGNSRHS